MSIFQLTDPKQLVYVTGTLAILSLLIASGSAIANQIIVARYVSSSWTLVADAAPFQVLQSALSVLCLPQLCGSHEEGEFGRLHVHLVSSLRRFATLWRGFSRRWLSLLGLLVLEPVATLAAAAFFGCFYVLFMSLTRRRVRTINEVSKETSQGLSRLVQQFHSGMRDIKLRDAGSLFYQ